MDKPSGGFFKGGEREKARDLLWLRARPPGRDSPPRPAREGASLTDTRRPGWPSEARSFPPHGEGGAEPGEPPGLGRPTLLAPCARDGRPSPATCSQPSRPSARFSYIRAGKSWTNPREDFSKEGGGKKARDLLWLRARPPGRGTGARRRAVPETAHRLGPLTVTRRGESPRSPPSSIARREEGKAARGAPGLQKHRFWSALERFGPVFRPWLAR